MVRVVDYVISLMGGNCMYSRVTYGQHTRGAGWPIIPQDIKQATQLIINDLKCNNIPYINSYIKNYESYQFTLRFDDRVFKDTGNRIADKILSAYVRPIYRLGVI